MKIKIFKIIGLLIIIGLISQGVFFLNSLCNKNGLGGRISSDSQPKYLSTAPTYTNGQTTNLQVDVNGNLKTVQRYSYSTSTADTLIKTGAGFIHTVSFFPTDAAATAGTINIYDSVTETAGGGLIFSYYVPAAALVPVTVTLDISMATGTYIGYTTTADVLTVVSYR